MTFLPIVERELRVRSRQVATYNGRWIAILIGLFLCLPFTLQRTAATATTDGQALFGMLAVLAFVYCLFGGARLTCDSLSSEKREGTLGLLFLTDLKGYDVVFGKLVSSSLSSFYGLLALTPIFGLPLFMGGVTVGEFWRMMLALMNTLFFGLAVGFCISAFGQDEHKIVISTNLLLLALAGALPLIDFGIFRKFGSPLSLLSPGYGCYVALDAPYKKGPANFWISLWLVHTFAWVFIGIAVRKLHAYRQDELNAKVMAAQTEALKWTTSSPISPRRLDQRRALLALNPVFWLALQERGQKLLIWSVTGLRLLFFLPLALLHYVASGTLLNAPQILGYVVTFLFWYAIAAVAARFFVQARRNGTMELLLSTPLRDWTILDGLYRYLKELLKVPLACLVVVELGSMFFGAATRGPSSNATTTGSLLAVLIPCVSLCLQAAALCYVALWLALSLKKPRQAAFRAFLYVVLIPKIVCAVLTTAIIVPFWAYRNPPSGVLVWIVVNFASSVPLILIHLVFIFWADRRLNKGIRAAALCNLTGDTPPRPKPAKPEPENDYSEYYSLLK